MILQVLTLLGVGFVGSVFWVLSPEAAAIYYGSELGWHPLAVGGVVAFAQAFMYVLLYHFGGVVLKRWGWLSRQVDRTRGRYQSHLERNYLILTLTGSMTGIPPIVALASLASGFDIPLRHFLPTTVLGRVIRFSILAAVGEALVAWWRG